MPKTEDIATHRTPAGNTHDSKLIVDLQSVPESLKKAAPQTNGEKHFDRTVAWGLFFAIYAASVVGAVVIKKHPLGNKGFYTPLKNGFRGVTNFLYDGSFASETEFLVEGGQKPNGVIAGMWGGLKSLWNDSKFVYEAHAAERTSDIQNAGELLKVVRSAIKDIEIANEVESESATQFRKAFSKHEPLLREIEGILERRHGIKLTENVGELLQSSRDNPVIQNLLEEFDRELRSSPGMAADIKRDLKTIIKDYKLDKKTEEISEIASLSMGGTAVVVPYKFYDDARHKAIIQEYDKEYGTGIDDPVLRAAALKRIDQTATQSWPSALMTRFGALGVLVATAYMPVLGETIIGTQKTVSNVMMETGPAKKMMNWIGKLERPWFPYKTGADGKLNAASESSKQFMGEMAAADLSWTVYTTGLMLAFSKVFAPIFGNKSPKNAGGAYTPYIPPAPVVPPVPQPRKEAPSVPMAYNAPHNTVQQASLDHRVAVAEGQSVSL